MTRPDPPGVCTCTALPAGHNDDQCAAAQYRRCWCGRTIPADSISYCGCCCTEHDDRKTR